METVSNAITSFETDGLGEKSEPTQNGDWEHHTSRPTSIGVHMTTSDLGILEGQQVNRAMTTRALPLAPARPSASANDTEGPLKHGVSFAEEGSDSDGSYSDPEADLIQTDDARLDPPTLNPKQRLKRRVASYVEDSAAPRVKFLSSIGGNIEQTLEGAMHYRGGETRLLIFYRDITYADLMFKITEYYLMPVSFKYQLPGEDLTSLVSVSSEEDLANMMEEYDHLQARCAEDKTKGPGSARLRVFLFPAEDTEGFVYMHNQALARNRNQASGTSFRFQIGSQDGGEGRGGGGGGGGGKHLAEHSDRFVGPPGGVQGPYEYDLHPSVGRIPGHAPMPLLPPPPFSHAGVLHLPACCTQGSRAVDLAPPQGIPVRSSPLGSAWERAIQVGPRVSACEHHAGGIESRPSASAPGDADAGAWVPAVATWTDGIGPDWAWGPSKA